MAVLQELLVGRAYVLVDGFILIANTELIVCHAFWYIAVTGFALSKYSLFCRKCY